MNKVYCLILTMLALACVIPAGLQPIVPTMPVQQPELQTAVVQTLTALAILDPTLSTVQITPIPTGTFTPGSSPSPSPSATLSSTPPATLTPIPYFSPTSQVVMVSVSVPTNCRSGPGKIYDYRGALLVGETTEVVGWEGRGEHWYVRNPDRHGDFCWLWGKYATLTGNAGILPVLTPPPTPTPAPNFDILSARVDRCVGWYISVKVKNTGGIVFESVSVKVKDLVRNKTVGSPFYNGFEMWDGCVGRPTVSSLGEGKIGYVQTNDFSYNPAGHDLEVTATMCSKNGGLGLCIRRSRIIRR